MKEPVVVEDREAFAEMLLACPSGATVDLQLFDGETPITAVPEGDRVRLFISDALRLHASLTPQIALRLSTHLAWAAIEALRKKDDGPEAAEEKPR